MSGKCVVLLFGLASLVAAQYSTFNNIPKNTKSVFVDDLFYMDDNTELRNRSAAFAYCQELGGELAKMKNFKLFKLLRASLSAAGSYWIDGVDNQTPERFIANNNCTTAGLSFTEIPEANFKPANCLVLVKEKTLATSKIEAVSCSNYYMGVICGFPERECNVTSPPPEGYAI